MTRSRVTRIGAIVASTVLAVTAAAMAPASASSGGGPVERRGDCTGSSQWRLKASPDNGRIRVEAEDDTGVKGQHWSWRLLHNGGVSARGNAVTKDGGSFEIQRSMVDIGGVDSIGWRSRNKANGERCNGNLEY